MYYVEDTVVSISGFFLPLIPLFSTTMFMPSHDFKTYCKLSAGVFSWFVSSCIANKQISILYRKKMDRITDCSLPNIFERIYLQCVSDLVLNLKLKQCSFHQKL